MTSSAATFEAAGALPRFRHEALLYEGIDDFVRRTTPFVRAGAVTGESVLVVVSAQKIDLLRAELGNDAAAVQFADMADVGLNPARIIPVWREFVDDTLENGRTPRGVGEPVWPERSFDEMAECHAHESLLNLAFADSPPWWLLCPYDTSLLDASVVAEAHRTHPMVCDGTAHRESGDFLGVERSCFEEPLPEPPSPARAMAFDAASLKEVRGFVAAHAGKAGLDEGRTADLVLAAHELATNSLRHGGGEGTVRLWRQDHKVVCEVRDRGRFDQPLVGRIRPSLEQEGGRGLWLANQLCDLVQIRSMGDGAVVRLHVAVD